MTRVDFMSEVVFPLASFTPVTCSRAQFSLADKKFNIAELGSGRTIVSKKCQPESIRPGEEEVCSAEV